MPISNYPHGFAHGVTMRDIPVLISQNGNGNVYWVDSVHGSNENKGTFLRPFSTLDYAVGRCTADIGDMIFVAAGHTETVIAAGGLDLDVAGITIIFLGEGSNRGTITFTTDVDADMDINADDITMINPRFVAGIDALTGPIDVNAANFKLIAAEWSDDTAIQTTDCIIATSAAIGLEINGWRYIEGTAGTQKESQIQLDGVDNALLANIDILGDFATGNIENVTDELLNVRFENVKLKNTNTGPQPGIVLDANSTGFAKNIDIRIVSGTTYVSSNAKLNWDIQCLGYNADGGGGDPIGTAGGGTIEAKIDAIQADIGNPSARTNFQNLEDMIGIPDAVNSNLDDILRAGFDSSAITANEDGSTLERLEQIQEAVNNGSGTSVDTNKSVIDAIGSNGTTLVYGDGSALGAIGTTFIVKKILTSSAILQAGVDITAVSSVGELEIEQIICKTDGTGLATGTNFQIASDNAKGLANILVETVANLGASKTIDLETASDTKQRTVLEIGKKLIASSTVADCTGAGTIDIYIKFKRIAAGAIVAAA